MVPNPQSLPLNPAPFPAARYPGAMTDLADTIETAAGNPARASADGLSVDQQPIKDLIEADQYLASKAVAKKGRLGMRTATFSPPGTS